MFKSTIVHLKFTLMLYVNCISIKKNVKKKKKKDEKQCRDM